MHFLLLQERNPCPCHYYSHKSHLSLCYFMASTCGLLGPTGCGKWKITCCHDSM